MLNTSDYDNILQTLSLIYFPPIDLLSNVEIKFKGKVKKFENDKIIDAYEVIRELKNNKISSEVHFSYENNSIIEQSENFVLDLIYS